MATLNYFDKDKGEWVAIALGGGGSGDSAVTVHDEELPQFAPGQTPLDVLAQWAGYDSGLHLFRDTDGKGASLALVSKYDRQGSVTLGGVSRPTESKGIRATVLSEGRGTTYLNARSATTDGNHNQLESTIVNQQGGVWVQMTAPQGDAPFAQPSMVDVFALPSSFSDQLAAADPAVLSNFMRLILTSPDFVSTVPAMDHGHVMQDIPGLNSSLENMYVKDQVDAKLDQIKDFSIANDNNLLAGLTALQDVVSNLGSVGTGQIDVLNAIKDAEIAPSTIKFPEAELSPIQWKGGLSLAPSKVGQVYNLEWNDGKEVHAVLTNKDLTPETILDYFNASSHLVFGLNVVPYYFTLGNGNYTISVSDGGRLQTNDGTGVKQVAYLSDLSVAQDLSAYAKLNDNGQSILAKVVTAQGVGFGTGTIPDAALTYTDTGEGYGTRLVFAHGTTNDYPVMMSDLGDLQAEFDKLTPGAWKTLPLSAAYATEPTRPASYRYTPDKQHIEFRGTIVKKDGTAFTVDVEVVLATLETADRNPQWVYGLAPTYAANSKPGIAHMGLKGPTGSFVGIPFFVDPMKFYLDGLRLATFSPATARAITHEGTDGETQEP